jgi:nitronate monooxygenase
MMMPASLSSRLKVPLIMAPMFQISCPEMVIAACKAGAIGSFPTINARGGEELDRWLGQIRDALGPDDAPFAPNLIMMSPTLGDDLDLVLKHKVEVVITSVGSPKPVIGPLHDAGCLVLADVATVQHARKAADAGVDGLILLTAGAGGQTGWANGFAFVRAVRQFFDGIIVLAGGVSDGAALWAAETLGCDLG